MIYKKPAKFNGDPLWSGGRLFDGRGRFGCRFGLFHGRDRLGGRGVGLPFGLGR